jgi:putative tricarboxylic transport membrane protein
VEYFQNLIMGFSTVLQPINFLYCFLGCLVGTLVGVLPGIGPVGAMAILLPSTYNVPPLTGVIMLAGIYYGAMYGGSTTSILMNIPGEAASVITCIDGNQMAKKGRAGPALGIAAFGSFIGGTVCVIFLMFLVYPLAEFAVKFGAPENTALMLMGLTMVTYLASGSIAKAFIMVIVGLLFGCVGVDVLTGKYRFTFGLADLTEGVPLVAMVMGLYGVSEVLENLVESTTEASVYRTDLRQLFPNRQDWKRSAGPIARGTFLGFFLGMIPGGGNILSSFLSYSIEKKLSKHPEEFGSGAIEGVAGPETANNAASTAGLIPLIVFGLPVNTVMALLMGTLIIHGIYPGPVFIHKHPDIFWGLVASMYLGNVMLMVLNLPLIPLWVKILKIPSSILFPLILLFCLIGVYSVDNSLFQVYVMIFFGVVGFVLKKYKYQFAPLILSFIIGPMLEQTFRQSLIMSQGSFLIFFTRPISAICMVIVFILLLTSGLGIIKNAKKAVGQESQD